MGSRRGGRESGATEVSLVWDNNGGDMSRALYRLFALEKALNWPGTLRLLHINLVSILRDKAGSRSGTSPALPPKKYSHAPEFP